MSLCPMVKCNPVTDGVTITNRIAAGDRYRTDDSGERRSRRYTHCTQGQ
jgi:hypothetical protein